jgi:hypothetical protein
MRPGAHVGRAAGADVAPAVEAAADHGAGTFEKPTLASQTCKAMNEATTGARPLTSVELLDAAVWREIGSEEPQPQAAFLEALSVIVGRWLLVRSNAPEMDLMTVVCRARGYIERRGQGVERRR